MSHTDLKISVIIPCLNEEKYIGRCIQSVLSSGYPEEKLEIIVCDGISRDNTTEVVKRISSSDSRVRLLENKNKTTPFALNLGIQNATGNIIIILGAHAVVDRNYLRICGDLLQAGKELGCVGGVLENIYEDEISESISLAMSSAFGVGTAHFRTGNKDGYVDTVAFGAYKREVFDKTGLFDETLTRNQDDEFNFRLIKNGYRIYLDRSIRALYYVRASFRKLFRQYYQYGYWKVFVNKKHGSVTTFRQLIPPAFVLFLMGGIPLAFFSGTAAAVILFFLGLYLIFSFLFSAIKAKNILQWVRICYSFYILHISYGFGYLHGLWDFFIMNRKPGLKYQALTR